MKSRGAAAQHRFSYAGKGFSQHENLPRPGFYNEGFPAPSYAMTSSHGPLGRPAAYPDRYDAGLLFAIPRADNRASLGIEGVPPFAGADIWNAYELSWLDARGKPAVAMATLTVPADSPRIVESKSLKLYLNSFNQTRWPGPERVAEALREDLSTATGAPTGIDLVLPARFGQRRIAELDGICLDGLDVDIDAYAPDPGLLRCAAGDGTIGETLMSRLLKSNCPVTGQPDWASVQIRYTGRPLDRAALLRYLVSFRSHAEFHEHCVERLYMDIMAACRPRTLAVYARYTRRGGLDINPWRATPGSPAPGNLSTPRQ